MESKINRKHKKSNIEPNATRAKQEKAKPFYNRSLERALNILSAFNQNRRALTLMQLAAIVKLPKTTVFRLCTTLVDFGFLSYDQQTNQYSLGLKLFALGSIVFADFSLRSFVAPYLTQLHSKINKTVFLGIIQNDELVYIDKREDPRNVILFSSSIGTRRPAYFGMLGQVLLAFMPESEVSRILQKEPLIAFTKKSIIDENAFRERLRTIKENGFAIDDGEAVDGISGISAPIRDFSGKEVGAIGVGFLSGTEDESGRQRLLKEVVTTAFEISLRLGYSERMDLTKTGEPRGSQFEIQ